MTSPAFFSAASSLNHHHHHLPLPSLSTPKPCIFSLRPHGVARCSPPIRRTLPSVRASDSAAVMADPSAVSSSSVEEEEEKAAAEKIGARVRVKVPLKVYHVPKVPEIELTGMEGKLKQYVGLWKGKRISANLPFKIEFLTEIEGRGSVKFFAHLKEDEFEYLD
ncbi:ferredoxin-thioredoxin reductase, variable chain [Cornus florida]|uniref:ferredoxin-thioredoxin reductase, variable chain n=1 Tax=Cornus florida TaxID=4283 RepID=UPI0028978F34|nr:ferredoxin-thioredoxin reductase, variable chain [Cornus florida]